MISPLMRRPLFPSLLIALLALALARGVAAQSGGGHTLFGDFRVDESKVGGLKPVRFDVLLYALSGTVVAREAVADRGRYRFENLRNGEYVIVVQVENDEVARIRVVLSGAVSTDFRQDISLEWRPRPTGDKRERAAVISATDDYRRSSANAALFNKAQGAIKRKQYDQAISSLRQIVGADPQDFEAWTELGTVHFIQKSYEDAEKAYRRALEVQPSFILASLNLGRLRMAQKNYKSAIEVLGRAVSAQPQSADANHFLGEAYLNEIFNEINKGSQDINHMNDAARKAVDHLSEAIRLDPAGKAEVHLRLADIYNVLKLKDKAVAECEAFLTKRPDYPDRKKIELYISENKRPPKRNDE